MPPPLNPLWVGLLRFATFQTFPQERNLFATKLAIDGFRYCKSEDCLSCDFCTGHFVDWTSGFLGAHLAHASQCSMLKKDIPKEDFVNEEKDIPKVDIAKVDNEKEDILKKHPEDTSTEDTPNEEVSSNLGNESAQASILPNEDVLSNASSDQIKNIPEEEDERESFCLPDELSNLEQKGINNTPLSLPSVSAETQKPEGEEVGEQVHTEQPTSFYHVDDDEDTDDEDEKEPEPLPLLISNGVTEGVPKAYPSDKTTVVEEKNILPSASQPPSSMELKHIGKQKKHDKANDCNKRFDNNKKQKEDLDLLPWRRKDETDSKNTAIEFIMQNFYTIHRAYIPEPILRVYPLLLDIQDQLYDESFYLESLRYGSFSKYRGMLRAGVPRMWFLEASHDGFFVPPDDPTSVVCFACGVQYPAHSLLCRRQVENLSFSFEPIPSLRLGDDAVVDTAQVINVLIRPLQFRGWGYSRVVDLHQDRRTGVTTTGLQTAASTAPLATPPVTSSLPQQPVAAPARSQCDICRASVNRRAFSLCCNLLWCLQCLLAKRICPTCNNHFKGR